MNPWRENTPRNFWLCQPDPPQEAWLQAYQEAFPSLGLCHQVDNMDMAASFTLGEGQFGSEHWKLSPMKQLYYELKPLLPRSLRYLLRQLYSRLPRSNFLLHWPIEERYVHFQWEVLQQLLMVLGQTSLSFRYFWPGGNHWALVLTHDIETGSGQAYVRTVADLEERLGFRSSFNFVPERYDIDYQLMGELRERGFEIGVHGLKHDGKLFSSRNRFIERAKRINHYLQGFGAVGFRSPLTLRNPEWMQALEVEYDLSFFDTDPYEPIPGGVMSIWPFTIGNFIELPYTLPQDCTLFRVFDESTPHLWLKKLDFIENYHGMALLITHPDYLREPRVWNIYVAFLKALKERVNYWHALPCEVARWWRRRFELPIDQESPESALGTILLNNDQIDIRLPQCLSIA
jgi:peptidoglycan/xylan/chitin deacetylase (PgdA/CDA1 family)